MTNDNCLEGIKCPQCGNTERFSITCTTLADVTDDGAEPRDMEWDDDSLTVCPECGRGGVLRSFQERDELPPDPEKMNDRRAAWAGQALVEFIKATGTGGEDAICDLLADLMHWCDRHGQNFDHELARGKDHYDAETLGDESTHRARRPT